MNPQEATRIDKNADYIREKVKLFKQFNRIEQIHNDGTEYLGLEDFIRIVIDDQWAQSSRRPDSEVEARLQELTEAEMGDSAEYYDRGWWRRGEIDFGEWVLKQGDNSED